MDTDSDEFMAEIRAGFSAPRFTEPTRQECRDAFAAGLADDFLAIAREQRERKAAAIRETNRFLRNQMKP